MPTQREQYIAYFKRQVRFQTALSQYKPEHPIDTTTEIGRSHEEIINQVKQFARIQVIAATHIKGILEKKEEDPQVAIDDYVHTCQKQMDSIQFMLTMLGDSRKLLIEPFPEQWSDAQDAAVSSWEALTEEEEKNFNDLKAQLGITTQSPEATNSPKRSESKTSMVELPSATFDKSKISPHNIAAKKPPSPRQAVNKPLTHPSSKPPISFFHTSAPTEESTKPKAIASYTVRTREPEAKQDLPEAKRKPPVTQEETKPIFNVLNKQKLEVSSFAENQELKDHNNKLRDDNRKLRTDNRQLRAENQQLKTDNQQLQEQVDTLTSMHPPERP